MITVKIEVRQEYSEYSKIGKILEADRQKRIWETHRVISQAGSSDSRYNMVSGPMVSYRLTIPLLLDGNRTGAPYFIIRRERTRIVNGQHALIFKI
jgi:hypothetical protein